MRLYCTYLMMKDDYSPENIGEFESRKNNGFKATSGK
jgi:hypothetical protein